MKTLNTYYTSSSELTNFIEQNDIKDSQKLLIQVFTNKNSIDFITELNNFFSTYFPLASLIGSTTDGEIKDGCLSTEATVISFTLFDETVLKAYISNDFNSYFQAGKNIASNIIEKDTKVIISFIDGLLGNGEEYLKGIHTINKKVIVSGGLAGDNGTFTNTYVFTKEKIYSSGIVGVSLSNPNLQVFTDYTFNWLPIGQKLQITKADKNTVYTIGDKTAEATYEYYLGASISKQLPSIGIEFPLILERNGIEIARAVINKNDDGSLVFAGNLKNMDEVRFGYGNRDAILNKTQNQIDKLSDLPVETIFIYSCMARRRFMPEEIENETIIYNQIAPTSGFYTYGEFFSTEDSKELLNQSMTILAMSESKNYDKKEITAYTKKNIASTVEALSHLIHVSTKELEQKDEVMIAQSRNAAMGEMLNMIAHQWRQPLNIITMGANNILADIELDNLENENLKEDINNILEHSTYLSHIIDDFKSFFNPTHEKEEVSVEALVEELKETVISNIEENNIQLIIQNNCKKLINVYKRDLLQVLLNLINNASEALIKNTENKRVILISLEENEYITIKVCDNAGGIDNKIINEIFNPYFSTKNDLNGKGLGLYISKIIVEKHMHGKLLVQNTEHGVCFTIKINK